MDKNITPLPWYVMNAETGGTSDQATIFAEHETDGEPTFIADTMGIDEEISPEERRANAALIVRAVNSYPHYEQMREAPEAFVEMFGGQCTLGTIGDEVVQMARKALADGTGE